jgi:hypothetical protein
LLISEKSFKGVTLKAIESPSSRMARLETAEKEDEESCGGICAWSDYCFYEWYVSMNGIFTALSYVIGKRQIRHF